MRERSGRGRPDLRIRRGQIEVIAAAFAFAASVPAGKILLARVTPLALSGVFYLSAGLLCAVVAGIGRGKRIGAGTDAFRAGDGLWLGGAVICGAVLAPLLLLSGLRQVSGHVAGLLLNFEAVFTVALGIVLSGERLGGRGWVGAAAVVAGAALLSLTGEASAAAPTRGWGVACVVGACALWGLDNNLTQRVSRHDARGIVAVKGIAGGIVSLALAAVLEGFGRWDATRLLAAAVVGSVCFGLSIVLFVRGLRRLGVLQTGMLFALAPGFAAVLSWIVLRERIAASSLAALGAMTAGALLLIHDRHEHTHEHEAIEHAHEHDHDEHHEHAHAPDELGAEPHAHRHRHERVTHEHAHAHDVHHRHRHRR